MTRLLGGILYGLLQALLLLVGIVVMSVAWLAGVAASVFESKSDTKITLDKRGDISYSKREMNETAALPPPDAGERR